MRISGNSLWILPEKFRLIYINIKKDIVVTSVLVVKV